MRVLSYERLTRDFPRAWATVEAKGEEVVVTRQRRRVARIVPEPPLCTALVMFGDLHGLLGERAGAVLARKLAAVTKAQRRRGTLCELRNPWAS